MAQAQQRVDAAEILLREARWGDEALVRHIVSMCRDLVNCRDAEGFTPLIHAATQGHAGIVHFLIGCGADLEASNVEGNTALHLAAYMGCVNTVELLVSAGASVDAVGHRGGTPLVMACTSEHISRRHTAVASYLVKKGATISKSSATTALLIAVESDLQDMAKWLVEAGANVVVRSTTKLLSCWQASSVKWI